MGELRNEEMLLIPGPTPVVDSIYDALAQETRSHTDARFALLPEHLRIWPEKLSELGIWVIPQSKCSKKQLC